MHMLALTWLMSLGQVTPLSSEVYHDFRSRGLDKALFRYSGPEPRQYIKHDANGLRITLLPEQKVSKPIGVATTFPIKGDFEITVGYDLYLTDPPTSGRGAGVMLYVLADPSEEAFSIFRVQKVDKTDNFMVSPRTTDAEGKRKVQYLYIPAEGKTGYLRLTRKGKEATAWAAETEEGDFKELYRYELGAEDLKRVEVAAYPGQTENPVDLLIRDIRIRDSRPPEEAIVRKDSTPPPAGDVQKAPSARAGERTPPPDAGKMLWVLGGLLGGGIALGGVVIWWLKSRSGRPDSPPETEG